jgi:DNA polymerase epsilon subunit 2
MEVEEPPEIQDPSEAGDASDDDDDDRDVAAQQRLLEKLRLDNNKAVRQLSSPHVPPDLVESRKVSRTLLDQGHLSPFPLSKRPVVWECDQALSLSPLPSVLVLADTTTPQFKVTYEGCHVINPGPFMERNKVNWMEYHPSTKTTEIRVLHL